jgi:hypothetical protein
MTKHEIERGGSAGTVKEEAASLERWSRPSLTRLRAEDAELGTRPNVADGAFSVS